MKKQSFLRILIVAGIISATFFVMAAAGSSGQPSAKEDCTAEKSCEQPEQNEFFLQSLTRSLISR